MEVVEDSEPDVVAPGILTIGAAEESSVSSVASRVVAKVQGVAGVRGVAGALVDEGERGVAQMLAECPVA